MNTPHELYAFDQADPALTLLPMAARRALDLAGVHLSLHGWQTLPLAARRRLVALGATAQPAPSEVALCLQGLAETELRAQAALIEPAAGAAPPSVVSSALGLARPLTNAAWSDARALDRYVLFTFAQRGKLERLAAAYDEIFGS
jgi:hypothetical protein